MTYRDGVQIQRGRHVESFSSGFWTPLLTVVDPQIPYLPLESPSGGAGAVLEGTALLIVTTAGGIITGIPLLGSSVLVFTSAGALLTGIPLLGTSQLVINSVGDLATDIRLFGTANLAVVTTGDLLTEIRLSGISALEILTAADLLAGAAPPGFSIFHGGISEAFVSSYPKKKKKWRLLLRERLAEIAASDAARKRHSEEIEIIMALLYYLENE